MNDPSYTSTFVFAVPTASMTSPQIENLLKLVGTARDDALLRFSLGNEFIKTGEFECAVGHLRVAVEKDAGYSAAWKLLGKALEAAGRREQALEAYRQGISVAEERGDKQASKEMAVYARRIEKSLASGGAGNPLP